MYMYMVWSCLWFQASTGGLGTYSPLIRVENGSRSCLYSYYCSATKCAVCKLLVTSLWWNIQRNWKKLELLSTLTVCLVYFLNWPHFYLFFFSFSNSFLLYFKKYWPGTDSEFWKNGSSTQIFWATLYYSTDVILSSTVVNSHLAH